MTAELPTTLAWMDENAAVLKLWLKDRPSMQAWILDLDEGDELPAEQANEAWRIIYSDFCDWLTRFEGRRN